MSFFNIKLSESQINQNPYIDLIYTPKRPSPRKKLEVLLDNKWVDSTKLPNLGLDYKVSKLPYQFLEDILNKKINGIALTILERIVDFFASFFDCYKERSQILNSRKEILTPLNNRVENFNNHTKKKNAVQVSQNLFRGWNTRKNFENASFVDKFIETHFNEIFNRDERQVIWNSLMHPEGSKPLIVQNLINKWWNLALTQQTNAEMLKTFKQLEKSLAPFDTQTDRWKKIDFVFSEKDDGENYFQKQYPYPYYYIHILCKNSVFFTKLIAFNDQWKNKNIDFTLSEMTLSNFNTILKTLGLSEDLDKIPPISTLNFETIGNILTNASAYGFLSVVNECSTRLCELITNANLDEETFVSIVDILKFPEWGANKNFYKTAEIFCQRYLNTIPAGENLHTAWRQLKDASFNHLEMPSSTTDAILQILKENVPLLKSLDLKKCPQITDEGLKNLQGFLHLEALTLRGNQFITYEGIWNLRTLPLKKLTIEDGPQNNEEDQFSTYFKEMKLLTTLELHNIPSFKGAQISLLTEIPSLNLISFSKCSMITEENLLLLYHSQLTSLDVSFCTNVTNACIAVFKNMPLKELDLCGCNQLSDECLQDLLKIKTLVSIKLPSHSQLTKNQVGIFKNKFERQYLSSLNILWDN